MLLESWLTMFQNTNLYACIFQVEEKLLLLTLIGEWSMLQLFLWLLKQMLPIKFNFLVTTIIPDRCACLCLLVDRWNAYLHFYKYSEPDVIDSSDVLIVIEVREKCVSHLCCDNITWSVCCPSTKIIEEWTEGDLM